LRPLLGGNPLEFRDETYPRKTRGMGLLYGENCVILASTVIGWSTRVTDRQTDRRTDGQTDGIAMAYTRYSYAVVRNKTYPLTPTISTHVRPAPVTGFTQPVQINDFITLYMLPLILLHFLCTHNLQQVHYNELLPSPLPQTPHGHLTAFCVIFCRSPLIMTLVLFISTLMPLFSMKSFHSVIRTRSSVYNSSHGKASATLNSQDKASMTIKNSKGLNAEPWCIPTFTSKRLMLP